MKNVRVNRGSNPSNGTREVPVQNFRINARSSREHVRNVFQNHTAICGSKPSKREHW